MRKMQKALWGERSLLTRFGAVALMLLLATGLLSQAALAQNTYVITDGSRVLVHTTYATDPSEVLSEAGLELGEEDTFTTQEESGFSEITINRVQLVTVNNGGKTQEIPTYGGTVAEILQQLGISPGEATQITPNLEAQTYDGMVIEVVYLSHQTVEYIQTEPYDTIYCTDASLAPGEEQVLTAGREGSVRRTARVTYENGAEASRVIVQEQVLKAPVTAIVARGIDRSNKEQEGKDRTYVPETEPAISAPSQGSGSTSRPDSSGGDAIPPANTGKTITTASGEVISYKRALSVTATAYSCEGYTGTTATGTVARYGAIAVDPTVIPYGTRMYIVSDDGAYIYGYATAEDCGGGIKGNKIDLYFNTVAECFEFGRRSCTVYILD